MKLKLTLDEVRALAGALEPLVESDECPVELVSAWLKLLRAQAQVTAPTPGVTPVGAVRKGAPVTQGRETSVRPGSDWRAPNTQAGDWGFR